jgi:hypothetical protein
VEDPEIERGERHDQPEKGQPEPGGVPSQSANRNSIASLLSITDVDRNGWSWD